MRSRIATLCLACALVASNAGAAPWQPTPGHTQIPIWPAKEAGAVPESAQVVEAKEYVAGKPWVYVTHVSRPTITVYSPRGKNTGAAVVVFPGGGYEILAMDLEGTEICDWLNSIGITAVLLKYRVPHSGTNWEQFCGCDTATRSSWALEDAQRAISLVRTRAAEWHLDPHKIGVIGFSAGGGMVGSTSTRFDHRVHRPVDAADSASCRPDFAIAVYPGHLYSTDRLALNPDLCPTRDTPPTLIVQAMNDPVDDVRNSLRYAEALKTAGARVELHVYAEGGHAFGLRPNQYPITAWPRLAEAWLETIGVVAP
jgi:acetyl esterase/lipase